MITLEDISKAYGDVHILNAINLTVSGGEVVGVVGRSGCGKTTLLRVIAGFLPPDSGKVTIDGLVINDPEIRVPPHLRNTSMVFQSSGLWPHMTVSENIRFTLLDQPKVQQDQRIEELLAVAGLTGFGVRFPRQLSGGEARRVSILRALAPEKRYLLMDEPLVNLDVETKAEIHKLIKAEARGRGVLYVTHDATELEGFADRVLRFKEGKVDG